LATVARYIAISYKIDYLQIFQAGYFYTKNKIVMVFKMTIISRQPHLETRVSNVYDLGQSNQAPFQ